MGAGETLTALTAVGVAGICAVTDVSEYRVPNVVTFPAMIAGLVMSAAFGYGTWWENAIWMIVLFFLGTRFRAFGMGDLKLMMALVALRGAQETALIVFFGGVFLMAYCLATERSAMVETLKGTAAFFTMGTKVPRLSYVKHPFAFWMFVGYGAVLIVKYGGF